jgi:hypothetical protein
MEPYPPQGPYPSTGDAPYPYSPAQPGTNPYSYSQPGAYPYPPAQPGTNPYSQPGAYPYPPQGAYPPGAAPYAPQGSYIPQGQKIRNRRANRAMIYGFISIFLGLFTLLQEVGAAGIITGAFAIFYGFTALKVAKQLPGNAGRGQAITGIVLGFIACFLVIVSLIIRSTMSGS